MINSLRPDLALIADIIPMHSRVLDVGCGEGALLDYLVNHKQCDGRGIEISRSGVSAAVARGLSVIQGDADTDLIDYPGAHYDYVVLSHTLQATHRPAEVLDRLLHIGRKAIVSVPNFGHWRARLALLFSGRMPVTRALPVSWYETENIHLCTIADFHALCSARHIRIKQAIYLINGRPSHTQLWINWRADQAVFVLEK